MTRGTCSAWWLALAVAGVVLPVGGGSAVVAQDTEPATQPAAVETDPAANATLAEMLERIARSVADEPKVSAVELRRAFVLLKAAHQLVPTEPRYVRVAAETALRLGESEQAIALLTAYRRLVPDDHLSQIRTIDLVAAQSQSATDREAYLRKVVQASGVPAPVKSHAALLAARTLADIGRDKPALEMLRRSIELNPVNGAALQMMYEHLRVYGTPADRTSVLTQLLQANVMQPSVIARVASELDAAGYPREAAQWYERCADMSRAINVAPGNADLMDYASLLIRTGKGAAAQQMMTILKDVAAADPGWPLMNVLAARLGNDDAAKAAAVQAGRERLVRSLAESSARLGGRDLPAAEASVSLPDINADVALIEQQPSAEGNLYTSRLADLAWFDVYAARRAPEPAVLAGLERLMGEAAITVARLRGWSHLIAGRNAEAQQALAAVAEYDPLSMMGMLQLEAAGHAPTTAPATSAAERARTLLTANRTGVLGALLHDGLKSIASPGTGATDTEVLAAANQFPVELFDLARKADQFYGLTIEPQRTGLAFGEPVMLEVTFFNRSAYPLTVGPDGVLKPTMWISATIGGLAQQTIPRVATPTIQKAVVIQPRESVSFLVRADAGKLFQALLSAPTVSAPMRFITLTNPVAVQQGEQQGLIPGGGGQQARATRIADRQATALNTQEHQAAVFARLKDPDPAQRIRGTDFLLGVVTVVSQNMGEGEQAQQTRQMLEVMVRQMAEQAMYDESAVVRSYNNFAVANFLSGESRINTVKSMLDNELWSTRLLGLLAASGLPAEQRDTLVSARAESDPDPLVQEMARATLELGRARDAAAAAKPAAPTEPIPAGEAMLNNR